LKAKICRYTSRTDEAIEILQNALAPGVSSGFVQADALLVFELAWVLLSRSRYAEAADAFLRMTKMNTWSHATYYTLAAGITILSEV
jgi:tetratricopeptide (TPR) repeat protein